MVIFFRIRIYLFILSLLITGLIYPVKSYASSINFVKDSQNPLNTNFFVLQSTVTKENAAYKMWFTGSNGGLKIGYATSTDGINWPSHDFVSVNDTGDNHDPSLFVHEGSNYIYYISEPSEGSGVDIKVKRSVANGSQFSDPQLISLPRQAWNSQKLSCPFGYFENGTYFLFYCGTSGSGWNLGMATSTDGVNFAPCPNNPIVTGGDLGNAQLYSDDAGVKHLLYHSGSGITETETNGPLSCNSVWSNYHTLIHRDKPYDQSQIIAPSLVYGSSPKELFYTARGPATGEVWRLNRGVENTNKAKIIIIPGFFASWNSDAVLHNQPVDQSGWKIPSYVHEYDGLINTLENIGYANNVDYFVFAYDWRKPLDQSADDLHNFLQTNVWNFNDSDSVSLVGHSMGGVLGRIYAQKYSQDNVSKIVTVGSPHKGVVQVYQPLEGGETKKDDSFLWLGTKLLINLNRKNFNNDREVVQTVIPSLFDMFPTFNFLKTSKGSVTSIDNLTIQNTLLQSYADVGSIQDKLTVIYGNKSSNGTPQEIITTNRALVDHVVKDYPDGRPIKYSYGSGDYLVPTISSPIGSNQIDLPLDHGELIFKSDAIKQILNSLELPYNFNQIAEGSSTKLSPSIIITAQSPIEMYAQANGQSYVADNGVIFIPDAESNDYTLHVKKLTPGEYTITVSQIALNNDIWEQFTGLITQRNVDEEDEYEIRFNNVKSSPQIKIKQCSKYRRGMFNFRKKSQCLIKHHSLHD